MWTGTKRSILRDLQLKHSKSQTEERYCVCYASEQAKVLPPPPLATGQGRQMVQSAQLLSGRTVPRWAEMRMKSTCESFLFQSEGNLLCESLPPGVCALRNITGKKIGSWKRIFSERWKVLKIAFLMLSTNQSTSFQNTLPTASLKGYTIILGL